MRRRSRGSAEGSTPSRRVRGASGPGLSAEGSGSGAGYSMVAELVSGVLGGLGLGWLFDKYAHTSPVGLIVGVLLGTVAAIFLVVKAASRFSDQAQKRHPGSRFRSTTRTRRRSRSVVASPRRALV